MVKSAAERKKALQKRTQQSFEERDQKGLGGSSVLDFTKAGRKFKFYEPKTGRDKNYIDILPFEILSDWYSQLRTFSGKNVPGEVEDPDYKLELPIHSRIGPNRDQSFVCLREAFGRKCFLCELRFAEYEKENVDEKLTDALKTSWRVFYNVFDYDDPDAGYQLWDNVSYHMFEKLMMEELKIVDIGVESICDLEEGKSIEFKAKVRKLGKAEFWEAHSFNFFDRDPYDENIWDKTVSLDKLLTIPTNEDMEAAYYADDEVPGQQQAEAEGARSRGRQAPEEEAPSRSRSRSQAKDTDNECPSGYSFGGDCNKYDECQTCPDDTFDQCSSLKEKETIDDQQQEPESEPETRRGGRGGRSRANTDTAERTKREPDEQPRRSRFNRT